MVLILSRMLSSTVGSLEKVKLALLYELEWDADEKADIIVFDRKRVKFCDCNWFDGRRHDMEPCKLIRIHFDGDEMLHPPCFRLLPILDFLMPNHGREEGAESEDSGDADD